MKIGVLSGGGDAPGINAVIGLLSERALGIMATTLSA